MAANALKKITTRAKQLMKKRPNIAWKTAVKAAGAEYRKGKLPKARTARKASTPTRRAVKSVSAGERPYSSLMSDAKAKLSSALLRKELATTKRDKRAAGKVVSEKRKTLKRLQNLYK